MCNEEQGYYQEAGDTDPIVVALVSDEGSTAMDLSEEETAEVLRGCEMRLASESGSSDWHVEILYGKQWLKLGRTDLTDDVRTFECVDPVEAFEVMNEMRDCQDCFGARVDDEGFYVIDDVTDG